MRKHLAPPFSLSKQFFLLELLYNSKPYPIIFIYTAPSLPSDLSQYVTEEEYIADDASYHRRRVKVHIPNEVDQCLNTFTK